MSEGITYSPTGTVEVTFDDKTYKLGRPKLKQWKHFTSEMTRLTQETQDRLQELAQAVAEASDAIVAEADPVLRGTLETAEAELLSEDVTRLDRQVRERAWADVYEAANVGLRDRYDEATRQLREFSETPFYTRSSELLREMFVQLGDDKLPDDLEEWPVWLATDVKLVGDILSHWRQAPKASGPNGNQ